MPTLQLSLWYEHDRADAAPSGRTDVNTGLVDPDRIPLAPDAHVHLCGPLPFMNHVRSGLLRRGVRGDQIAYEVFGPEMLTA
jgi:nitric oxide dioxygenase